MTPANRRANITAELTRADESMRDRLEADYGRDFVLTERALKEDVAACEGFLERARALVAPRLA